MSNPEIGSAPTIKGESDVKNADSVPVVCAPARPFKDQSDLLFKIIQRYDFYINSTNAKATLLVAFNTSVVGVVVTKWGELTSLYAGHPKSITGASFALCIVALSALFSLVVVLQVIYPFLETLKSKTSHPPEEDRRSYRSLIFFGDVAKFETRHLYSEKINNAQDEVLLNDLASQVHVVAQATIQKFKDIKAAIQIIGIGLLIPFAALIVLKFLISLRPDWIG